MPLPVEGKRRAILYVLLAYAISWTVAGISYLLFPGNRIALMVTGSLFMYGPLAASLILVRSRPLEYLGVSFRLNWWMAVAWLAPVLLTAGAIAISGLLPGHTVDLTGQGALDRIASMSGTDNRALIPPLVQRFMLWIILGQALVAGPTINAVFAFGEEAGWRGLLLRELAPLGFWRLSLVTGIVWGLWHLPLTIQGHNYPQHPVFGILMMTVFTTLLSPIIGYVRIRARSVLAAAVMHGSINAVAGMAIIVVSGGNDLTRGLTGAAGAIVLLLANFVLLWHNQRAARKVDDLLLEQAQHQPDPHVA